MRYLIKLSYQGTHYSGWQRQTNTPDTIQQIIEEAISRMIGVQTHIHGCGRTDAGVHASEYFAHLDIEQLPNYDFIDRINYMLPEDIAISEIRNVAPRTNAQHDARWRTYEYYFHLSKNPSIHTTSAYYNLDELDIPQMQVGIEVIKRTKDFRSLCKQPNLYKNTDCIVKSAQLDLIAEDDQYRFTITANRFLRGMIRYMIARLLDLGTGKLPIEQFEDQLASRASFDVPFHTQGKPEGLFLSRIEY